MRQVRHLLEMKGNAVFTIAPESPVLDAIRTMAERGVGALLVMRGNALTGIVTDRLCTQLRVRHLPVVEGNRLVGIVSIGDLVKAVIDDQATEIDHLQRYIAG